jgi:RNA polymerase sigma-70 factor (ECF subfamily)
VAHEHHHESDETVGPDAAAVLVGAHREFLAFLERRVGDRAVAEDILQDAFVRGLEKLDSVRDEDSVVAWFYRVLRNAVIDHYRRRASSDRKLEALARELEAETPSGELDNVVCRCVGELARTLKPEYADVLARVEIDGVAVKDYADEAGITSNNAGVRVFRAREALKKQVKKSCGTCAEHGCLDCTCQKKHH